MLTVYRDDIQSLNRVELFVIDARATHNVIILMNMIILLSVGIDHVAFCWGSLLGKILEVLFLPNVLILLFALYRLLANFQREHRL